MSPELNGNPPVLIKRKKNRDKKHGSSSTINEFNTPNYNFFPGNLNSYPNVTLTEPYYSFPSTYPLSSEPMSLPIYSNMHLPMNIPYNGNLPKVFKIPVEQAETSDYMSLPVVNGDQNEDTGQRRFSDPGLPNESDSSYNSTDSQIIQSLTHQITILKENNRKLNREVTELRMELNMLKHQQNTRHYERDYEPGMISDLIREIRDAARVREDALLAKVKHIVEEKQLSMGQFQLVSEKNRNSERLSKLEEQMKSLTINTSRSEDNISLPSTSIEENVNSARQVFEMEREALLLRRELQDARARKEESDQKILQLDKKITNLLRPKETAASETSEDSKTSNSTSDILSVATHTSRITQSPHKITLSGPVTDL